MSNSESYGMVNRGSSPEGHITMSLTTQIISYRLSTNVFDRQLVSFSLSCAEM